MVKGWSKRATVPVPSALPAVAPFKPATVVTTPGGDDVGET